jgi:hypothetical protein
VVGFVAHFLIQVCVCLHAKHIADSGKVIAILFFLSEHDDFGVSLSGGPDNLLSG